MNRAVSKILILIFLGLFTALSLAEPVATKKSGAEALMSKFREVRAVDLTLNRTAPKPPPSRNPASIKRPIPWYKIPFFDIGNWYGKGKLFGGEGAPENTGMGEAGHDHDHDHDHDETGATANGKNKGDKAVGFGYDDNRAKSKGEAPPPAPPQKENPPVGDIPPPKQPPTQVHGVYYPVCMMFPPSVQGKANAIAKRFVEIANNCKVNINLVAIPINEPGDPKDAEAIAKGATQTCNAQFGLGVAQASAMVATNDSITADVMCKQIHQGVGPTDPCPGERYKGVCYKTNTAGCAALCKQSGPVGYTAAQLQTPRGGTDHGNGGQAEGIIPSIIDVNGQDGATASHEAMGHSQMCWRNGREAGNGIEVPGEEQRGVSGHGPTDGNYTDKGCAQMRANALPNTSKIGFDPTFTDYLVRTDKRWELGEPYWLPYGQPEPPPPVPPRPPPPQIASGGGGGANPGGQNPNTAPPPTSRNPQDAPPPSGHKKKGGGGAVTVVSVRNGSAGQGDSALNGIPDVPGGTGKPGSTEAFGYDESNLKAAAGDVSGNGSAGGSAGAGGVKGFGYDDNNVKSAADGSGVAGGAGGPGGAEPGAQEGVAGPKGEPGAEGAPGGGRRPASILNQVKNASAAMDDEFFKKLKLPGNGEDPKPRGSSLRGYDRPLKPLYQGGSVAP